MTVPRKSTSSKRIRRHFSHVPPDERTVKEGIPVTSVHRTIFDLAPSVSVDEVVAMIKEAEYHNRYDRLSLWDLLERYPGKRGSRNLRAALGPKRYRVDCHWPDSGQIVELDWWEGHRTKSAFQDDRARDRALRVAGYSVVRLTWNQLDSERDVIAADLRKLLDRGRTHLYLPK